MQCAGSLSIAPLFATVLMRSQCKLYTGYKNIQSARDGGMLSFYCTAIYGASEIVDAIGALR